LDDIKNENSRINMVITTTLAASTFHAVAKRVAAKNGYPEFVVRDDSVLIQRHLNNELQPPWSDSEVALECCEVMRLYSCPGYKEHVEKTITGFGSEMEKFVKNKIHHTERWGTARRLGSVHARATWLLFEASNGTVVETPQCNDDAQ
jgi:hypothetical protein